MSLLFCSLHTFTFQVWSHVHFAVDQDDNVTVGGCSEDEPMNEEPTIILEAPMIFPRFLS